MFIAEGWRLTSVFNKLEACKNFFNYGLIQS